MPLVGNVLGQAGDELEYLAVKSANAAVDFRQCIQ
jgi:hypothetical protein